MKPFTFRINETDASLPTVSVPAGPNMKRDAVSQVALLSALAEHMSIDLDTEEGAAAAYEAEEALAREYRLSPATFLRPPSVPLAQSGTFRYVPVELDPQALAEAAEMITERLKTPEGRDDWEAYIHILDAIPYAPALAISPAFLNDTALSMCEQWGIPTAASDEVQQALIEALVTAGMSRGGHQLHMPLPFDAEAGLAKMQADWLDAIGEDDLDLWKLVESYVGGGFDITLAWRAMKNRYLDYDDTPAWPLRDVVQFLMHGGQYAIQTLSSHAAAWFRPGDEDVENKLNTAGGLFEDSPREAWKHYIRYGRVMVAPFEIPDIAGPMEDIAALWAESDTVKGQGYVIETKLLEWLSVRYARTVTARDLRQGLARPDSPIYRAFKRSRLNTTRQEIYQDHLWVGVFNRTVHIEPFNGARHSSRMGDSSRSVIPVYVLNLLAGHNNEVHMMTLAGPREAITAAFARLFGQGSRRKYATAFSVGGYTSLYPLDRVEYDHSRARIPDARNQMAMTLLTHQAIPGKFSQESPIFLLLMQEEEMGATPAHFLGMLDRAITLPLLPSWAEYLWVEGIDRGLISPLPKQIGNTAGWIVGTETHLTDQHGRTWQNIIRDGLLAGIISIQEEADIAVDEIGPDNIDREITNEHIERDILQLMRESAATPAMGD